MKKLISTFTFHLALWFFLAAGAVAFVHAESSVANKLLTGEKQLQQWADELQKKQPETLDEAWDALEVLVRAERDEAVIRLFPRVRELALAKLASADESAGRVWQQVQPNYFWCYLLYTLPVERAKLAITFLETSDTLFAPGNGLDNLMQSMKKMGWSDEQIFDWVNARYQSALTTEEKGNPSTGKRDDTWFFGNGSYLRILWPMSGVAEGWHWWYLDLLRDSPQRSEIVQKIMENACQSPDDMKKLVIFLQSFDGWYNQYKPEGNKPPNMDWLLATVEKRSPLEAWVIAKNFWRPWFDGNNLEIFREISTAEEAFLKGALAEPLAAEELKTFCKIVTGRNNTPFFEELSDELLQAMFRVETLDDLNKVYLQLGRGDDAQRVMLEARELRKKHSLRDGSFLAGMTQSFSGFRVVENEIKEREKQDETKPKYWIERAEYYRGRKEPKEEEEALRRALDLYDAANSSFAEGYRSDYYYRKTIENLFDLLWDNKRYDEAILLFKTRRAAARHNPDVLGDLYRDCEGRMIKEKRFGTALPGLVEDLRDAYEWLKTTPKNESREYQSDSYRNLSFLGRYPAVAIHSGVMDFEKDPFAWDVLAMMKYGNGYFYFLLFPKDAQLAYKILANGELPSFDPDQPYEWNHYIDAQVQVAKRLPEVKPLQKLKDMASSGMLDFEKLQAVCAALKETTDIENRNWFLLKTLEAQTYTSKSRIYEDLIANYLAMGDWQNGEKNIERALKANNMGEKELIEALRSTANFAEKSGASEAAQRMRERIKNTGESPSSPSEKE